MRGSVTERPDGWLVRVSREEDGGRAISADLVRSAEEVSGALKTVWRGTPRGHPAHLGQAAGICQSRRIDGSAGYPGVGHEP